MLAPGFKKVTAIALFGRSTQNTMVRFRALLLVACLAGVQVAVPAPIEPDSFDGEEEAPHVLAPEDEPEFPSSSSSSSSKEKGDEAAAVAYSLRSPGTSVGQERRRRAKAKRAYRIRAMEQLLQQSPSLARHGPMIELIETSRLMQKAGAPKKPLTHELAEVLSPGQLNALVGLNKDPTLYKSLTESDYTMLSELTKLLSPEQMSDVMTFTHIPPFGVDRIAALRGRLPIQPHTGSSAEPAVLAQGSSDGGEDEMHDESVDEEEHGKEEQVKEEEAAANVDTHGARFEEHPEVSTRPNKTLMLATEEPPTEHAHASCWRPTANGTDTDPVRMVQLDPYTWVSHVRASLYPHSTHKNK